MKHPTDISSPELLNLSPGPLVNPAITPSQHGEVLLKRAIVDMKAKDISYHEIIDHFAKVYGAKVTKGDIAGAILEAGKRARHLNGIYDRLALQQSRVLEVDEIYQGRQDCYLGVVGKASRYLFLLDPLDDCTIGTIAGRLEPLAVHADSLELVVTDLRRAYRTAVPLTFGEVAHLACQVHACRAIMEHQDAYNRAAREARKKLQKLQARLGAAKKELRAKRRQLKRMEDQLAALVGRRDEYYRAHGIRPYSKTSPWTPERLAFKAQLENLRARVRSKKKTVVRAVGRATSRKGEVAAAGARFWVEKQASLQVGRLVRRFKDVLACPPGRFEAERARFEGVLRRSPHEIAPKILKFMRDNPHVFATKVAELARLCPPSQANTNTVEGIFGVFRPLLTKARHFPDSPVSRALFAILRLRHNLSCPYTGPHSHHSPLERCGVRPKHSNYLDALFPLPGQEPCATDLGLQNGYKGDLPVELGSIQFRRVPRPL